MRRRIAIMFLPAVAAILGGWAGLIAQTCPTCFTQIDGLTGGKMSGTNKCFSSYCQSNVGTSPPKWTTSIQQCLQETCKACKNYSAGTPTVCPASQGYAACGTNEPVLCANLGDC